jgi:hypothetical protein
MNEMDSSSECQDSEFSCRQLLRRAQVEEGAGEAQAFIFLVADAASSIDRLAPRVLAADLLGISSPFLCGVPLLDLACSYLGASSVKSMISSWVKSMMTFL